MESLFSRFEIIHAEFTDAQGERRRSADVLAEPPLALFPGHGGLDSGLEPLLKEVAAVLDMDLVLLGHVNGERYTAVAVYTRNPALTMPQGTVIPIHETYCREEITADKPFVLGDATLDERFKDHPGYTKYRLRSYVGAPIVLWNGTVFGTLCAVDTTRKVIPLGVVERLVAIADAAAAEVSARLGLKPPRVPRLGS